MLNKHSVRSTGESRRLGGEKIHYCSLFYTDGGREGMCGAGSMALQNRFVFAVFDGGVLMAIATSCIWSVAVCGSETWTVGKNEERVINGFETWSWRGMLKIKWTDRITNGTVFQRAKEGRLLLKMLKKKIDATHG
jgi:hypothetical protein